MNRDLGPYLLGPAFKLHTPESFYEYIMNLRTIYAMGQPKPKPKREKKPTYFHQLNELKNLCLVCGKRARSAKAKCLGDQTKKVLTEIATPL